MSEIPAPIAKNLVKVNPGTKYRRGGRHRNSGAVVTYKFSSGANSLGDMVSLSNQFPSSFEGDARLPLRSAEITAQGGGFAVGVGQYGLQGFEKPEVFRKTAYSAEIEVWHAFGSIGEINTEWSPFGEGNTNQPSPRKTHVTHHELTWSLSSHSNPKGAFDAFVDTANGNEQTFDGVRYAINSLWFKGVTTVHLKQGGYDEWNTQIVIVARDFPGKVGGWWQSYPVWDEKKIKVVPDTRRMFELKTWSFHFN